MTRFGKLHKDSVMDGMGRSSEVIGDLRKREISNPDRFSFKMAAKKKRKSSHLKEKKLEMKRSEIRDTRHELQIMKQKVEDKTVTLHLRANAASNKPEDLRRLNEELEYTKKKVIELTQKYDNQVLDYEKMKDPNFRKLLLKEKKKKQCSMN